MFCEREIIMIRMEEIPKLCNNLVERYRVVSNFVLMFFNDISLKSINFKEKYFIYILAFCLSYLLGKYN